MKKLLLSTSLPILFLCSLSSCSEPDAAKLAEKTCTCGKEVTEMIKKSENLNPAKIEADFEQKFNEAVNKFQSCLNNTVMQDARTYDKEAFKKKLMAEVNKQCPDLAKFLK